MTILITGGAGFIGSNFVHDWISHSDELIINLDKLTYAGNLNSLSKFIKNPKYVFVQGDICDSDLVASLLKDYKPRAVINFAAESHVDRSIHGPFEFIQTNIIGTYQLLQTVLNYWRGLSESKKFCFRFLQISTDEVYGSLSKNSPAFVETNRYEPNSPYSASKAASDHLVRAWHQTYGLPVITTNCSNNYGPYQFPEKFIPLLIINSITDKKLPIYGNGNQIRDWLHVKDHCSAIRRVLAAGCVGENYNIGGCNEKMNIEIVKMLCSILDINYPRKNGKSYANQIIYVTDRPGHDERYAINSSYIKSKLDWVPSMTIEKGLEKTVCWYLNNMKWWSPLVSSQTNKYD